MRPLRRIQPAFAALLAACVVLLGLAARSPDLHAWLHHPASIACSDDHAEHAHEHDDAADQPDGDHACAVTLFASGCDVAPTAIPLPPLLELSAARVATFTELLLARTLRGPERVCGPPALA